MGTRSLICVVKDNEYKVAQYSQWDGYPEGQGVKILKFIRENNIEEFKEKISKCSFVNGEEKYSYLNRDTGADILSFIIKDNDENIKLENSIDFAQDSLFCEWAYVIDLDKNTFEVYEGFNKEPLSKEERFYSEFNKKGYYPVKHVISFDLNELPTKESFLNYF